MLQSGQNLSTFRIIKKLGAGGMGEVYLAEDTKLQREVALKTLLPEFFENEERRSRFQREARTAAKISHPNVMSIFDIDSAIDETTGKEINFIVMEHIDGKSLKDYLESNQPNYAETTRLAEHIASGLAAAHQLNIIHRDIKASNIIINSDNQPKILDFGLAKPIESVLSSDGDDNTDTISQELTKAGNIIGTLSYMSPEQIRGETVDTRSDVFSFGILLYRMMTGKLPFEGDTQVSIMAKILETPQDPVRSQNDNIPQELERIIDKCLQKKAEDRYQDTRDLVVDLRNLRRQSDSEISSRISGLDMSQYKDKKTVTFNLSPKMLLLIVPVLIVAGWFLLQILEDDSAGSGEVVFAGENGLAILGFANKTGEAELDWLQTGLPEILQTDLAQNESISIISRDRVVQCLEGDSFHVGFNHPHKDCLKAAGFLGAKHSISGTFYKMGENIRIDARLEELETGRIISTSKVVGTDPFTLVDSLTDKIALSKGNFPVIIL